MTRLQTQGKTNSLQGDNYPFPLLSTSACHKDANSFTYPAFNIQQRQRNKTAAEGIMETSNNRVGNNDSNSNYNRSNSSKLNNKLY